MMKRMITILFTLLMNFIVWGQEYMPFDTAHWAIEGQGYITENFMGRDAIYLKNAIATLKDVRFKNGTIEFDIYLRNRRGFPGIQFRVFNDTNGEHFYFRPPLSGQVDANQATPIFNGVPAWQLYFGPAYSFSYDYEFEAWTHVRLVVNEGRAQLFLNHADAPNLTWTLKNQHRYGEVAITASLAPVYYANVTLDTSHHEIIDDEIPTNEAVEGLIPSWEISNPFPERAMNNLKGLPELIQSRSWLGCIEVEENNAANISRLVNHPRPNRNTVFTRLKVRSDSDQIKLFEFGYSDRAVVILNGDPIYRGTNQYRSRDYRYLGTIGLFDSVYLNLKEGENTILLAISETFGGWGVTARFLDYDGIKIME